MTKEDTSLYEIRERGVFVNHGPSRIDGPKIILVNGEEVYEFNDFTIEIDSAGRVDKCTVRDRSDGWRWTYVEM